MTVCAHCRASYPENATICPMCGTPRVETAAQVSAKTNKRTFWYAFGIGFLVCIIWIAAAAPTWFGSGRSAATTFYTVVGAIMFLGPLVALVATYVPAVPERYRTPIARRVAAGLLVGVLGPLFTGVGAFVGLIFACGAITG